eukprot:GHVH01016745.1.p2 GENE.GHVH01016745.1~~GHVH01016745.1.p2  ORF type:complete len:100 (-),score=6.34 GHVH01016745.1:364-663(-)
MESPLMDCKHFLLILPLELFVTPVTGVTERRALFVYYFIFASLLNDHSDLLVSSLANTSPDQFLLAAHAKVTTLRVPGTMDHSTASHPSDLLSPSADLL